MKLLDCTLRDGGYYTLWDFPSQVVSAYIEAMNKLPIDYLEVGYRNNPSKEYLGELATRRCLRYVVYARIVAKRLW